MRSIRPFTDRVSEPEKIAPPRAEARRTPTVHPATQAAVGGLLEKPQIAGIEHLQVLIANERKDRTSSTGSESKSPTGLLLFMRLDTAPPATSDNPRTAPIA